MRILYIMTLEYYNPKETDIQVCEYHIKSGLSEVEFVFIGATETKNYSATKSHFLQIIAELFEKEQLGDKAA